MATRKITLLNDKEIHKTIREMTGGTKAVSLRIGKTPTPDRKYIANNVDEVARNMACNYLLKHLQSYIVKYADHECMLKAPYHADGIELDLPANADADCDYYYFIMPMAPEQFHNHLNRAITYLTDQARAYINRRLVREPFSFNARYLHTALPTMDHVISKTKWVPNTGWSQNR